MMESLRCIVRQMKGATWYKWYMLCRISGGTRRSASLRLNGDPYDGDTTR